eukprot:gene722-9997_t
MDAAGVPWVQAQLQALSAKSAAALANDKGQTLLGRTAGDHGWRSAYSFGDKVLLQFRLELSSGPNSLMQVVRRHFARPVSKISYG